jgi:energy-coupling factor transporter ATP-binding protein EcfA2
MLPQTPPSDTISRRASTSKTTQLDKGAFELPEPQEFRENVERELPLTLLEEERILQIGRQQKYAAAYSRWYSWKLIQEQQPQAFTAEQIWTWFHREAYRRLGQEFRVDDNNRDILRLLCYYFAEDEAFEAAGYSLEKGILLRGPVGCGKTTILTILSGNPRFPYRVVPCKQIANEYKLKDTGGPAALYDYKVLSPVPLGRGAQFNYRTHLGHCFDDLGTENWRAKHMGNETNVMEDILSSRDDAVVAGSMPRFATHMTTNLPFNDLRDEQTGEVLVKGIDSIYGSRVRSRIRGMFNVLTFPETATDRRA